MRINAPPHTTSPQASPISALRARIRAIETGGTFREAAFREAAFREAAFREASTRGVSTGHMALDRLLPGGLPKGSVVAIAAQARNGEVPAVALAWLLALYVSSVAQRGDEHTGRCEVVLVDHDGVLYPPALAALGLDLDRTLLLHPGRADGTLCFVEEALGSRCVASVVGEMRRPPLGAELQRLERAAQAGGGLGVLVAMGAAGALHLPVVLGVERASGSALAARIAVVRARGACGGSVVVQLDAAETLR